LTQEERIQHTLTAYACIKQPELWAQWVRNQVDNFDGGLLTNCQAFMNAASLKFTKIAAEGSGTFEGSASTIQEDIVAMMATAKRKKSTMSSDSPARPGKAGEEKKLPPFVKHFKSGTGDNATAFKVGDKKEWNDTTWYFCDCPTHRDCHKWHTHTHDTCRTRKKWLADGGSRPPPVAQIANDQGLEASTALTTPTGISSSTGGTTSSDITTMLAAALSMAGDNMAAREAIADALNAIHDV
jgi:hypothetical protein